MVSPIRFFRLFFYGRVYLAFKKQPLPETQSDSGKKIRHHCSLFRVVGGQWRRNFYFYVKLTHYYYSLCYLKPPMFQITIQSYYIFLKNQIFIKLFSFFCAFQICNLFSYFVQGEQVAPVLLCEPEQFDHIGGGDHRGLRVQCGCEDLAGLWCG